jgi:hypothetical protein
MVVNKDYFDIKKGSYVFTPTDKVNSVTVDQGKGPMKALRYNRHSLMVSTGFL